MRFNQLFTIGLVLLSTNGIALELGLSTSGEDLALSLWADKIPKSSQKGYLTIGLDSNTYQNDTLVSDCNDGAVSASTGSGTCSGHGGVSKTRQAEYDRAALIFGMTHNLTPRLRFNAGLAIGMYFSDVTIRTTQYTNYFQYGLDMGASYQITPTYPLKLSISHETERGKTLFGFWYPL